MTHYKKQTNIWSYQDASYIVYELKEKTKSKKKVTSSKRFNKIHSENRFLNVSFGGKPLYKRNGSYSEEDISDEDRLVEIFKETNSGFWILVSDEKSSISRAYPFNSGNDMIKEQKNSECKIQNYFPETTDCSKEEFKKFEIKYREIKKIEKKSGNWIDAEELCEAENKRKWDISEDQLRNLKIFCAKPKEKS